MHKIIYLLIVCVYISSCGLNSYQNGELNDPEITTFSFNSSIRAIEVVDENTCWFAGSNGLVGLTSDGGLSWTTESIEYNEHTPEFRSIAITDSAVFVLSVASPALLYRSADWGKNWELVYMETHPDCFYNSMKFFDSENGIAVGDPIEENLSILITTNGGDSWTKIPSGILPSTAIGEAGFAASNTNISIVENNVWIASGGKKARVFHSKNRGQSWEVYNTPIIQGGKMTGIFSVDFYDQYHGIIWGGDWENQQNNINCKAITKDGGKNWIALNDSAGPAYRSCVQYIPEKNGKEIIAVGIPGITYTPDGGMSWKQISDSSFYTIRVNVSGKSAWMAGKNKVAKMTW